MDLDQITFAIVDVETTGLRAESGDRIVEIGAIKVRNGSELGRYQTLVNPERPLSPEAIAINGITPEMVADAPPFRTITADLLGFLNGSVLVAHNAGFDMNFINCELIRIGRPRWKDPVVDTVAMARHLIPGLPSYRLDALAQRLGITFGERHRSIGDVEATVDLFHKMLGQLKERNMATLEFLLEKAKAR